MTLSTLIHIDGDISPEGVFATARRLIGIPDGQPLTIEAAETGWMLTRSIPGDYAAALYVAVAPRGQRSTGEWGDETPDRPLCNVVVSLDSTRDEGGTEEHLHRHICAELGRWLDTQGADWWANDENTGEWHHRTPAPLAR